MSRIYAKVVVDGGGADADVPADFDVGDAVFGDERFDEARFDAKSPWRGVFVEEGSKRVVGRSRVFGVTCGCDGVGGSRLSGWRAASMWCSASSQRNRSLRTLGGR